MGRERGEDGGRGGVDEGGGRELNEAAALLVNAMKFGEYWVWSPWGIVHFSSELTT